MRFQTVIVGAGSAGCVLASRLSENSQHLVLLLEAGPDYPSQAETPIEFLNPAIPWGVHDWGYSSESGLLNHSINLERGKLVGGCSAVNAGVVVRGTPSDYEEWSALGLEGWSFPEVLPFFLRIENDPGRHAPATGCLAPGFFEGSAPATAVMSEVGPARPAAGGARR